MLVKSQRRRRYGPRLSSAALHAALRHETVSLLSATKRVAGLDGALLVAGHEPLFALRRRAVGEGIGHDAACGLALQRVVADRARRGECGVDVARLQEVRPLLRLAIDPDTGQAVGLQFDLHLERIRLRLAAGLLLQARHARNDAEQVLDVMAGLMGDDVGGGEVTGGLAGAPAKTRLDLAEETGVEEDGPVGRTIEWSHRRLRPAAAPAIGDVAEQHDLRTGKGLARGLEDLAPAVVDLAEDAGDHAAHLVGRRAALGRGGLAIGLVGRRLAAAGEDLGAADQDARIDAEGVADQAEHDDGADAEPAAAHGEAEPASSTAAATIVATILDVVAAAEIIVAHGGFPRSWLASLGAKAAKLNAPCT